MTSGPPYVDHSQAGLTRFRAAFDPGLTSATQHRSFSLGVDVLGVLLEALTRFGGGAIFVHLFPSKPSSFSVYLGSPI